MIVVIYFKVVVKMKERNFKSSLDFHYPLLFKAKQSMTCRLLLFILNLVILQNMMVKVWDGKRLYEKVYGEEHFNFSSSTNSLFIFIFNIHAIIYIKTNFKILLRLYFSSSLFYFKTLFV